MEILCKSNGSDRFFINDDNQIGSNVTYQGILSKWTNYIHGWQERFVLLKDGTLTYFKSENDSDSGCRGAMSVFKCNVTLHEFDECRFDVSLGDSVWCLRASTAEERDRWVEAIVAHHRVLATLSHCMDLMQQRGENWKRKWEIEVEKRKKLEELVKTLQGTSSEPQSLMIPNDPDYEEGPHSKIKEEEFFDAVDAMLDRKDQQEEEKRQLKLRAKEIGEPSSSLPEICDHPLWPEINKITLDQLKQARLEVGEDDGETTGGWELFAAEGDMRLYKRELLVDGLVCDPLKAVHTVRGITGHEVCYHFFSPDVRWDWENTLESMKVVEEINPNTLVFHQIHKRVWPAAQRDAIFWSHIRKLNLNQLSPSSSSPSSSSSTSSLSVSSSSPSPSPSFNEKKDPDDIWIVCNNSTDRNNIPLGRCVRMKMTVSLTCETFIEPPSEGQQITRDNLICKIIYCSTINPGGWAPASVLRALYKREYPKFLKNFTQYVIDARKDKPIMF